MTKENRERTYKHFRDLEKNYVALPGRNHDLEKEDVLKAKVKKDADAMLEKHPELAELDKPIEKPKSEKKKDVKESKR